MRFSGREPALLSQTLSREERVDRTQESGGDRAYLISQLQSFSDEFLK